ncbi:MAG: oligosaccharide flippase family protein [Planctomycetaceae bacterium]
MNRVARLSQQIKQSLEHNPLLSKLLGGASVALLTQVGGHVLKLLSFACLARWATRKEDVGIYASAWSLVLILSTVSALGLKTTTLRFMPEYLEHEKWSLLRGFLRRSYLYMALVGFCLAVAGSLVLPKLNIIPQIELSSRSLQAYLICLWIVPLWSFCEVRSSIIRSTRHIFLAFGPLNLIQPITLIAGCGIIVLVDHNLSANQIMIVMAISVLMILIIQEITIRSLLSSEVRTVEPEYDHFEWRKIGIPYSGFLCF